MLTFIETSAFSRERERYLDDESFSDLQATLIDSPELGDVIPSSGGVRKMRWKRPGMGKRGGLRIIYYFRDAAGQIWLLGLYAKSHQSTVPGHQARKMKDDF